MGIPTAAEWAEGLDGDALHDITALLLRRIVRLEQGDWEGAEQLRRDADVLSVQAHIRQMFSNLTSVELAVHTMARDLTGLRQCMDQLSAFAAAAPGWVPYQRLAEARFELVRGNFERAATAFAGVLELVAKDVEQRGRVHGTWAGAVAGYVEAKVELGLLEQAQAYGEAAIAQCRRLKIGAPSFEIARPLAIAEARLGLTDGAARRLDDVISAQRELGAAGIHLGVTYEARARVAMLAGDEEAFQKYARLASIEYRHGFGSPLGALYERLMDEARRTESARENDDRPTPKDSHVTVIRKA